MQTSQAVSSDLVHPLGDEHVFLMGRPPFEEYLNFMSSEPIGAQNSDLGLIAQEWRTANDHIKELQATEKTWADNPPTMPMSVALQPLVAKVLADPYFQRGYYAAPVELGMVELDRLVVFQKSIDLGFVRQLKAQLGPNPSEEAVFRLSMPGLAQPRPNPTPSIFRSYSGRGCGLYRIWDELSQCDLSRRTNSPQ